MEKRKKKKVEEHALELRERYILVLEKSIIIYVTNSCMG